MAGRSRATDVARVSRQHAAAAAGVGSSADRRVRHHAVGFRGFGGAVGGPGSADADESTRRRNDRYPQRGDQGGEQIGRRGLAASCRMRRGQARLVRRTHRRGPGQTAGGFTRSRESGAAKRIRFAQPARRRLVRPRLRTDPRQPAGESMRGFVYTGRPSRVVFGRGTVAAVADEVARLGHGRVLLLGGRQVAAAADEVQTALASLVVARFDDAAMHTPVDVTDRVLQIAENHAVDCVVSVGGGSTTGLSQALAARKGYDQVIVPTTYAGSEVTPVLGETQSGVKTTRSGADILPETVVYDVDLTLDLPAGLTLASTINAMAHAVEALYAPDANPVTDGMALQAITAIVGALPAVMADPADLDARSELLRSAWLAGTCLAYAAMGLHHKLCHTLGGSFGLPHAQTHTAMLPYTMAYNASAAPAVMARIADAMRVPDAPAGVFDLVSTLGGATSIAELGFARDDIGHAAELATAKPYPNPREVTRAGIAALLDSACAGRRPGGGTRFPRRELDAMTRTVLASFADTPDPRLHRLITGIVEHAHRLVTDYDITEQEWTRAIDFLTRTGQISSTTRQEFVSLSDILGVSTVVDMLTNSRVKI